MIEENKEIKKEIESLKKYKKSNHRAIITTIRTQIINNIIITPIIIIIEDKNTKRSMYQSTINMKIIIIKTIIIKIIIIKTKIIKTTTIMDGRLVINTKNTEIISNIFPKFYNINKFPYNNNITGQSPNIPKEICNFSSQPLTHFKSCHIEKKE